MFTHQKGTLKGFRKLISIGLHKLFFMDELSTLAGIVGSDGHLSKSENAVIIVNKDLEFINETVVPLLKKLTKNKISISKTSSGYSSYKYLVRVWDKNLQEILHKNYGIPRGKKYFINLPSLPSDKMISFILGWIAGDGSVTVDRKRPKIEIWSKDVKLMRKFQKFLFEREIGSTIFKASNNRWILRIGKRDDVKKFSNFKIPHPAKDRKLKSFLAPAEAGFRTS